MSNKSKIIIAIVILVIILAVVFFLAQSSETASGVSDSGTSTGHASINSNLAEGTASYGLLSMEANSASSIQDGPAPKDYGSPDDDIDTYLKAYRTAEQPDPDDFDDTYSDLR